MRRSWPFVAITVMLIIAACNSGNVDSTVATSGLRVVPPLSSTVAPATSQAAASSTTVEIQTTTIEVPTTVVSPPDLAVPLDGWHSRGADSAVFGAAAIADAVVLYGRIIVVGCPANTAPDGGFPVWFSDGGLEWTRATGDAVLPWGGLDCLQEVMSTPLGLFAHGQGLLRSVDGVTWERVEFLHPDGWSLGWVDAVFAVEDRVTVLLQRGAEAESTVATLFTTTDGETWEDGPSAELFDSSGIGQVMPGGDGLLAVGASPWGEFVPTAAVWTSADGLNWRRVTPRSAAGLNEAFMYGVAELRGTFVAVGGDPFASGLMASWTSADGSVWFRSPPPIGDTAAEHGFMEAHAIANVGGRLFAIGRDIDAALSGDGLPALWESADGVTWTRWDLEDPGLAIPFSIVELEGRRVGFWPPSGWPAGDPVQVLTNG